MEGYLSLQGTLNVSRVWAVIEGQQFSYYDDIDVHTKTPTKLRGNLQLKNAMIRKYTDNNCKYGLKIKTSIPIVKRVYIGCNDKDSWEIWFHSLARANKAHLEEEDRKFTLNKYFKLLMIPNLYADKLTPEFVEHAYETVLSKESNEDKRQELKQAYEELLAVAEEVVESKHCKAIQYDVIVKKTEEFGLGIVLGEEKARQRVVVREVNPNIQLEGISEEGGDGIHIKDALVGIDHIDCSLWYASRVRARLGDILVPKNETVKLTFERRVLDDTMLEVLNQPEEFDNTINSSLDSNNNTMNNINNNNTNNNLSSSLPSPLNRSQTIRSEPFRPTSWLLNREPSMSQSAQTPLTRGPSFSLFKTASMRNVPSQAEYNDLQKQLQEQKDLVETLKHQLQQYEEETLRLEKQNECLLDEQISWEEKCRKLETQVFQCEQEVFQIKQEKELLAKELHQKDQLLIQQLQQENEININNNSNNSNSNHKETLSSILSTSVTPGPVSFSSLDSPIPITSKPSLASMPSSYTPTNNNNTNNSQQYTPYKDYILLLHQKLEQLQPQTTPSKEIQATNNNNNNHTNYSNNNHNIKSQNNQSGQVKPILWSTIKANDSQSSQQSSSQSSKHIQQLQHKYQQQNILIEDVWKLIQPLQSNNTSQPTQPSQQFAHRNNIFNIEDL